MSSPKFEQDHADAVSSAGVGMWDVAGEGHTYAWVRGNGGLIRITAI